MQAAWRICHDSIDHPAVIALLRTHAAGCEASSPPGTCYYFDHGKLKAQGLDFVALWDADTLLGVAALAPNGPGLEPGHGELKSMHVASAARGRGAGAALMQAILKRARVHDLRRVSLETGVSDYFAAAQRLYARHGFAPCGPFGNYTDNGFSRFMTYVVID